MRLIDADALGVGKCSSDLLPKAYRTSWNILIDLIKNAPTIDAVPVRAKPKTNADRIRAMSDEELANVISCPQEFFGLMGCPDVSDCTACKQKWLQQPAEVE